jgi:predicted metal-dependent enzyme (double-stranded beta helix superfamily)
LARCHQYNAWLIAWSPCSNLELHDHCGSEGVLALLAGTLVETFTDVLSRAPVRTRALNAPEILAIPASRVHEVSNPGPLDALSVHVYSPPLTSMTFYDCRPDRLPYPLATVEGDVSELEEI